MKKLLWLVMLFGMGGCLIKLAAAEPVKCLGRQNVLGGDLELVVWAKDDTACARAMTAGWLEAQRLEKHFSAFRQGSEITQLNQSAGQGPVMVSQEMLYLLKWARRISEKTQGAFDISSANFVWQYGFGQGDYHVPSILRLEQIKPLVHYQLVVIYPREKTVVFKRAGVQIDLTELLKNYLLERLLIILKAQPISAARITFKSNVAVLGKNPEGAFWIYSLRHPRDPKRYLVKIPFAEGKILVCSDYEQYFIQEGKRYHPYIDSQTGLPAQYSQAGVLYLPAAGPVDLPASILMLLPPATALELVKTIPGAEALIVNQSQQVWLSPNWSKNLKVEKP